MRVTPSVGPRAHVQSPCHSTRLSPVGDGRSTTNSVRCAGNTCSLSSTGVAVDVARDPLAAQHRRADRHLEQLGVGGSRQRGADGLRRAAERHGEQLVERRALDVGPRQRRRRVGSGHHTVTRANGSPSARFSRRTRSTCSTPEHRPHARGGAATKPKSRIRRSATMPALGELRLDRAEPAEVWRSGSAATNQPKPCRESTRPSSRSSSSARADRDPAGVVRCGELGLARQQAARGELARLDPAAAGRRRSPGSGSHALVLYLSTCTDDASGSTTRSRPWP